MVEIKRKTQWVRVKAIKYENRNPARACYICGCLIDLEEYYYCISKRLIAPYPISICTDPDHARETTEPVPRRKTLFRVKPVPNSPGISPATDVRPT